MWCHLFVCVCVAGVTALSTFLKNPQPFLRLMSGALVRDPGTAVVAGMVGKACTALDNLVLLTEHPPPACWLPFRKAPGCQKPAAHSAAWLSSPSLPVHLVGMGFLDTCARPAQWTLAQPQGLLWEGWGKGHVPLTVAARLLNV